MQIDFKYEIKYCISKCKYRDIIITNKSVSSYELSNVINSNSVRTNSVRTNCIHNIIVKDKCVISYYSDSLRYYSFGFMKSISVLKKIPAYYTYNIVCMTWCFHNGIVIGKIIMYWDVSNVNDMYGMFLDNRNKVNIKVLTN